MISIEQASTRGGAAGLFLDPPTTPQTPISPIATLAALMPKLKVVDAVIADAEKLDAAHLERVSAEVGRAIVGARIAALCTQEMQTCSANPRISPIASDGIAALEMADLRLFKDKLAAK